MTTNHGGFASTEHTEHSIYSISMLRDLRAVNSVVFVIVWTPYDTVPGLMMN